MLIIKCDNIKCKYQLKSYGICMAKETLSLSHNEIDKKPLNYLICLSFKEKKKGD